MHVYQRASKRTALELIHVEEKYVAGKFKAVTEKGDRYE